MGLRAEFKQVPINVFDALGDVVLDAILRQYSGSYAPGGVVTTNDNDHGVRIVEDTASESELIGGIAQTGDKLFLTPVEELTVEPKPKDSIVITEDLVETVYNIYRVETDPAEALWAMYARQ